MRTRYIIGGIFIILGLSALTGIDLGRFIGPLFLIFIGWMIMTRGERRLDGVAQEVSQDALNEVLIFSGSKKSVKSQSFKGGKIAVVFAGFDLDLSTAKSRLKEIDLELVSVFGGIRLRIPKNWKVTTSEAVGIIGGVENRTKAVQPTIELRIKGAAVFGGIEISN